MERVKDYLEDLHINYHINAYYEVHREVIRWISDYREQMKVIRSPDATIEERIQSAIKYNVGFATDENGNFGKFLSPSSRRAHILWKCEVFKWWVDSVHPLINHAKITPGILSFP